MNSIGFGIVYINGGVPEARKAGFNVLAKDMMNRGISIATVDRQCFPTIRISTSDCPKSDHIDKKYYDGIVSAALKTAIINNSLSCNSVNKPEKVWDIVDKYAPEYDESDERIDQAMNILRLIPKATY